MLMTMIHNCTKGHNTGCRCCDSHLAFQPVQSSPHVLMPTSVNVVCQNPRLTESEQLSEASVERRSLSQECWMRNVMCTWKLDPNWYPQVK